MESVNKKKIRDKYAPLFLGGIFQSSAGAFGAGIVNGNNPPSPPAFDPTRIDLSYAYPIAWYEAEHVTFFGTGPSVTLIPDLFGLGNDATQPTQANAPRMTFPGGIYGANATLNYGRVASATTSTTIPDTSLEQLTPGVEQFTIAYTSLNPIVNAAGSFWSYGGNVNLRCLDTLGNTRLAANGSNAAPSFAYGQDSAFHAYIMTWDNTTWRFYMDRVLKESFIAAGNLPTSSALALGKGDTGFQDFAFSDFIVYGGVPKPDDLTNLWNYFSDKRGTP